MRLGDDLGEEGGDCGGCGLEVVGGRGGVEDGAGGEGHAPDAEVIVVGNCAAFWKKRSRRGGGVGDGTNSGM